MRQEVSCRRETAQNGGACCSCSTPKVDFIGSHTVNRCLRRSLETIRTVANCAPLAKACVKKNGRVSGRVLAAANERPNPFQVTLWVWGTEG